MKIIEIDLPRAVELVLGEIAKKPEGYKYQDHPMVPPYETIFCRNILPNGSGGYGPGCLIGSAFISAGVTVKEIFDCDGISSDVRALVGRLNGTDMTLTVTDAAHSYLDHCQSWQDSGNTWSASHAAALEYVLWNTYCMKENEKEWAKQPG